MPEPTRGLPGELAWFWDQKKGILTANDFRSGAKKTVMCKARAMAPSLLDAAGWALLTPASFILF